MFQKEEQVRNENTTNWQGTWDNHEVKYASICVMHQLNVKKANISQANLIFISEDCQLLFNSNAFQFFRHCWLKSTEEKYYPSRPCSTETTHPPLGSYIIWLKTIRHLDRTKKLMFPHQGNSNKSVTGFGKYFQY